jgi:hypothetical protein
MKPSRLPFAFLLAALILSACNFTVNPPGDGDGGITADVTAAPDRDSPAVASGSLTDGESRLYRVAVPADVSAGELVRVELDTAENALLAVLDAEREELLVSRSADWFGPADSLLQSAAAPAPLAITVTIPCRGTCIQLPAGTAGDEFFVRVTAGGDLGAFELFLYGTDFEDTGEPNGSAEEATQVPLEAGTISDSGAIETSGDADWYQPEVPVTGISFIVGVNVPAELDLTARVFAEDDLTTPLAVLDRSEGEFAAETAGRYLVAVSEETDRAGPASASRYELSFAIGPVVIPVGDSAPGSSE